MRSPLKWFGGKSYLAKRIIALFPPHKHYVEPFAGGLSVLLSRDPSDDVSELVNDLDSDLVNFWRVLRHPTLGEEFIRQATLIPMSRTEWDYSEIPSGASCSVERALRFFVRCRQSFAGAMQSFTPPTRTRTRRGMNGNVSEWLGAVELLPEVADRLRTVFVEDMDALDLIPREDKPTTLFYCDPPYVLSTRNSGGYAHEMDNPEHKRLCEELVRCDGSVILSGYRNEIYDDMLHDWHRIDINIANHASGAKDKPRATECLWLNFTPEEGD